MYADPQGISVNAVPYSLPRIPSSNPTRIGQFSTNDGNLVQAIRQDKTNQRFRREIRLTNRKVAADPISAVNKEVSASIIVAVDEPKFGFTDVELVNLFTGLISQLQTASNAKLYQLLGGEL